MFKAGETDEDPLLIDMRENRPEYNGFAGNAYWDAIYFRMSSQQAANKLISGAHASLNMHLASNHIERMSSMPGMISTGSPTQTTLAIRRQEIAQ